MREPPELADETIIQALEASFGIRVARLGFLPIGNDDVSWAYRVEPVEGPVYFLKVRAGTGPMPGASGRRRGSGASSAPRCGSSTGCRCRPS